MKRQIPLAIVALIVVALGGAALAVATTPSAAPGEHVACTTASATAAGITVAGHSVGVDGAEVKSIPGVTTPGTSDVQTVCVTATDQTVPPTTGQSTTSPTTSPTTTTQPPTTAPTTTAVTTTSPPPPPPPGCTRTLAAGGSIYSFASSLVPGDTGCIHAGTYGSRNGSNRITLNGTAAGPITLQSVPGETATIIGDNQLAGQYGTFSGLKFDVATDDTGSTCQTGVARAQTFFVSGSNLQVTHNEFTTADPAHSSNGMYVTGSNDRIDHNKIHGTGSCHAHDHGVYVGSGTGTIIDHNWIYDEAFGWGIQLYPSPSGGATQPNIYSNTLDHNESGFILCTSGSHWHVVNNVVSNSTGNFQASGSLVDGCGPSGSDIVVSSNDQWLNPGGYGNYASGNISVDPQYENAAAKDFKSLSPSLISFGLWDGS